jgi:hypothetical protein
VWDAARVRDRQRPGSYDAVLAATDDLAELDEAVLLAARRYLYLDGQARGLDGFLAAHHPDAVVRQVDGVQRVDARLWIDVLRSPPGNGDSGPGGPQLGVCASWAAGAVLCAERAEIVAAEVRREVIVPVDELSPIDTRHGRYEPRPVTPRASGLDPVSEAIGRGRGTLEGRVAVEASRDHEPDLVVVDGPLGDVRHIPGAVGYVKAHHVTYLPPEQQAVVDRLGAGQRTPLFRIGDRRFRYSWYLRLPGPGPGLGLPHPRWGVVRCEAQGELPVDKAILVADQVAASLPRFASRPHQDGRAPQNLHPIAGLERQLKHRLGDAALLERALRLAAQ